MRYPLVKAYTFIPHRQRHLTLKSEASQMQFMTQTFLIGRFHEAWAKFAMHFDRGTDDLLG
jgi:hypothetical protein